jgi:hypothetical protein
MKEAFLQLWNRLDKSVVTRNSIALFIAVWFALLYWNYVETFEDEPSRKTLWVQTLHVFAWSLPLILNTRATTTRYDGFMGIAGCLPTFLLTVRGPYLPTAVESGFAGWSMTTDLFIVFVAALWLLFWLKYSRRIQYSWKGMVVLVVIWCLKPFHIILCGQYWYQYLRTAKFLTSQKMCICR